MSRDEGHSGDRTSPRRQRADGDTEQAATEVLEPRQRVFLPQSLRERLAGMLWTAIRVPLFQITPTAMNGWRTAMLRLFGAKIGSHCVIHQTVRIDFPWNLVLESKVVIEHRVIINCMGTVTIGEGTRVSQYAHLCAGTHDYRDRHMPIVRKPITIGKEVWIAADAFVGPGVSIGDGSLLAARSSAFGDLPAGQVCVGEPARPQKARFTDDDELPPTLRHARQTSRTAT